MKSIKLLALVGLMVILVPSAVVGQERGSIRGQVVNATTQQPLVGVQVVITGTSMGTVTNQQGQYLILNVPAGQHEIRASFIGYSRGVQTVTVGSGATATANLALTQTALELEGVIATATGQDQRRREIGSSVANISVGEVDLAPVTSMSQLLQGRAAGVTVTQSSGTTGAGSRVRIRGNNSLSLSNAPLLVIDGVRVYNAEASIGFGVGGQTPSRLDDLNPEDIASIEILRGPSAAALYGTAAANGVIQVTTRRGQAGVSRFDVWTEYGQSDRNFTFPENVSILDADDPRFKCPLVYQNSGICDPETVTHRANPLENSETTPFGTGERRVVGGSVSGGGDAATFYVSGEYMTEDGVYLVDNTLDRVNLQANLTGQVSSTLNVGANIGYMDSALQLPQADNALFGIIGMGMFGDADPASIEATGGYENDPQFHHDWQTFQDMTRVSGSVRGDYRPTSWLNINALAGLDRIARTDINRLPRETAYTVFGSVYRHGFIQNYGYNIANYTASGSATGTFNVSPDIVSTTTLGTSYNRAHTNRVYAFGAGLSPGSETSLAGATSDFSASELNVSDALVGTFFQQQVGWQDRIFLNAAVRGDRSSAFGTDYGWAWYPSVSGSWVLSEESFFPATNILDPGLFTRA